MEQQIAESSPQLDRKRWYMSKVVVFFYLSEGIKNHPSSRAVKNVDGGCLQPGIKFTDWQGNVLCITLLKHRTNQHVVTDEKEQVHGREKKKI